MSIVSEKQFLTTEELQNIKDIQSKTQSLILELGEIEMIKIQLVILWILIMKIQKN